MTRDKRLRAVPILAAALLMAAGFTWLISPAADAQNNCPPRVADCGEPPWQPTRPSTPSPTAVQTATATRRPATADPTATSSPTVTAIAATPTATMTPFAPTATAIAVTETPEPEPTRVNTPTSTATATPAPATTPASMSTKTPTAEPPATAAKPVSTQIPQARIAIAVDPGRHCIPHHAAAPVRLCPTHSGSGWWIYDTRTGQILHDNAGRLAHVPFNERLPAGQVQVLFKSSRLLAVWLGNQVVISTTYANGKAYVFSIFTGGRTAHWNW